MAKAQPEEQELRILGQAIRQTREQSGLGVQQLAEATGIEGARICQLEEGRLDPDFELLLALAHGLGVRLTAFIIRAEELSAQSSDEPRDE